MEGGDILPAHYGEEGARRTSEWMETFAPRAAWAATLGAGDGPQAGWTLTTVL